MIKTFLDWFQQLKNYYSKKIKIKEVITLEIISEHINNLQNFKPKYTIISPESLPSQHFWSHYYLVILLIVISLNAYITNIGVMK